MATTRNLIRMSTLGATLIALALATPFLCFAQATASKAAPSLAKFAGTWKENESKRTLGPSVTLKFRLDAKGNLEELRGADARPLVQSVRFDGKPHNIDASNNRIAWKQIDKNHFERKLFEGDKLLTTRDIQISDDAKTLTEATTRMLADGKKNVVTMKFRRTKGDAQGLAGIWQAVSYHSTAPTQWKYEAMADHLMVTEDTGVTFMVAPDGKPVAVTGPGVISGTMVALKVISPQTIEMAQSREGVPTGKVTATLSADGKVMTLSAVNLAPNASREPSVIVVEKQ